MSFYNLPKAKLRLIGEHFQDAADLIAATGCDVLTALVETEIAASPEDQVFPPTVFEMCAILSEYFDIRIYSAQGSQVDAPHDAQYAAFVYAWAENKQASDLALCLHGVSDRCERIVGPQ